MVVQGMECGGAWQLQAQGYVVAYHVRPLVVTTSITVWSLVCITSDPQRLLGLLGVTKAGPPYGAPQNEGSWLLTLPQQSKLLLTKEFTLQTKQFQLRGRNDAGNMNPLFLPSLQLLSSVSFHCVAQAFQVSYRDLPELVSFVDAHLIVEFCSGTELGQERPSWLQDPILNLKFCKNASHPSLQYTR